MRRILIPLFSPATGTWGGLTRVTAIADAAMKAGHAVAFCASGYLKDSLERRGYLVYPMLAPTMLGLPKTLSRRIEQRSQNAAIPVKPGRDFGSIWFVMFLSGMGNAGYLRALLDAEQRAAQDFAADAIFTDLDPAAAILSALNRLPLAMTYQTPMAGGVGTLPWKWMDRAVNRVLRAHGRPYQPIHELCHGPRVLKIIPSIPELEGSDPQRPDVCYVGSLLGGVQAAQAFTPQPGKRYVFAYLGTGAVPLDRLRAILPQVFPADGDIFCLVGAQSLAKVERIGNVEFRPYIPAGAVLPHCEWTLCHGGQNTIIESLSHDVPLIIFPGPIFERRYNARRVRDCGAGVMGELPDFTPAWLREQLARGADLAPAARQLGERIRSLGGAAQALNALESWRPN